MMYTMRQYTTADYPMIESWWKASDMPVPPINAIPEATTFIVEMDNVPAISLSLVETNISAYAYVDFFVGNPKITNPLRQFASTLLVDHIVDLSRTKGYERLIALSLKPKLTEYYTSFEFRPTFSGITCLMRDL